MHSPAVSVLSLISCLLFCCWFACQFIGELQRTTVQRTAPHAKQNEFHSMATPSTGWHYDLGALIYSSEAKPSGLLEREKTLSLQIATSCASVPIYTAELHTIPLWVT